MVRHGFGGKSVAPCTQEHDDKSSLPNLDIVPWKIHDSPWPQLLSWCHGRLEPRGRFHPQLSQNAQNLEKSAGSWPFSLKRRWSIHNTIDARWFWFYLTLKSHVRRLSHPKFRGTIDLFAIDLVVCTKFPFCDGIDEHYWIVIDFPECLLPTKGGSRPNNIMAANAFAEFFGYHCVTAERWFSYV